MAPLKQHLTRYAPCKLDVIIIIIIIIIITIISPGRQRQPKSSRQEEPH